MLGLLMLDTRFPRPPGDIGHPATFGFPVRRRVVEGAAPGRVVRGAAEDRELRNAAGVTDDAINHDTTRASGTCFAHGAANRGEFRVGG